MKQKTFGQIVDMEPTMPSSPHDNDIVLCSNGRELERCNAYFDCRDTPHFTEEDRESADIEIVEEILDAEVERADRHATENSDFAEAYDCIVTESSDTWKEPIEDWILDNYDEYDDCLEDLVPRVVHDLDNRLLEADWEYNSSWAAYSGPGCCLWGAEIGELEEQIEVNAIDEFARLHNEGRLADILDIVNCDAYVSLSRWSLRGDCPCFEIYHNPIGRWDCVVSEQRMRQAVTRAIIALCRGK